MEPAVGIDLGTTNCSIAYINEKDEPEIIKDAYGESVTPSVVMVDYSGNIVVGFEAKERVAFERENIASFFKRDMGTETVYPYNDREFKPVDFSAELLKKLKKDAEAYLGMKIEKAVITVPAYFQDRPRVETKKAAEMAGLEVLNIINEPTSAALAYGFDRSKKEETVLVYDLGGGTFDISLVKVSPDSITVIGTDGNHNLGGKDWDDRLVKYVCEEFERVHNIDPLDDVYTFQEILVSAEKAKKELSSREKTIVQVSCEGITDRIEINRKTFENLTMDLLGQTEILMQKVLEDTGYGYGQISSVIMVGGSTRMPMCKDLVKKIVGKEPNLSLNPDECVAMGAAIKAKLELQSEELSSSARLIKLQDVTAHSMGLVVISADGSRYENAIILPKNRSIPAEDSQIKLLKTSPRKENQLEVYLLQGESERPLDNALLGKYTFHGVPHYDGETRIKIVYKYDSNGIVNIEAFDEHSGRKLQDPIVERGNIDISWTDDKPQLAKELEEIYVMLVIDTSYSMEGKKLQQAKNGALNFMKNIDLEYTSIGITSFDSHARLRMYFTKSSKDMEKAVKSLEVGGATEMTKALKLAYSELINQKGRRVIVLLTDGEPTDGESSALSVGETCKLEDIEIITIGTDGADKSFLSKLATSDEGQFFASVGDISDTFSKIAQNISQGSSFLSRR